AVQEALGRLVRRERVETVDARIRVDYAAFTSVRKLLPSHEGEVLDERFGEAVDLAVRVPASNVEALRVAIANATGGQGAFSVER
ncbi:MAG TPA: DUF1949 domain-containing protein, partial [Gemmatimonadaceae bacterium]|nr:DUF1949 domain-containing protein [Gemmatimonadaceae bacterium]